MEIQDTLFKIKEFADRAHGEQTRKYTPDRYIVHPMRVMELCRVYTQEIPILSAAILHDVLEDTPVKKEEIFDFLLTLMDHNAAERTINLVVELTDVYVKKDYSTWNRRKRKSHEAERMEKTSADAQTIKYADIIDNSLEIGASDPDFGRVFLYECRALLRKMNKGNPELYKKAIYTVDNALLNIKRRMAIQKNHLKG